MNDVDTQHAWWSRLRHQGMVLSPVVMLERFPEAPQQPPFPAGPKLRDAHTKFLAAVETQESGAERDRATVLAWTDALLASYIGHGGRLGKQGSIPEKLTAVVRIGSRSETIKPDRVIFADGACSIPAVLVMADSSSQVGRGRGRIAYSRFLELLRGTGHRLGLLTNGHQFRLIYAGLDFESWCEWESERWFDDGDGSQEVAGLRQLLSPESLKPVREKVPGLLDAIEESRKRQADLSSVLRENVRQAVELLLEEVSSAHRTDQRLFDLLFVTSSAQRLTDAEGHEALMQAAVRVVMRMVVCLFAESRGLLPTNDPIYGQSYGVRTLYEQLDETTRNEGGLHGLLTRRTAWPRLMALFRLIYGGSSHGSFPLRRYSGALFRPGVAGDPDHVSRALDLLERHVAVSDATVFAVLRKLLRGPLPVIRGRSRTFVDGPVDYTDLRTEFIGLIYEGLLDYRVKRADEASGPQIFLNLGREPVLPLSRLEQMLQDDAKGLKDLLTTLRKEKVTASAASEEDAEDDEAKETEDSSEAAEDAAEAEPVVEGEAIDPVLRTRDAVEAEGAALAWAKKAILLAGLVRKQGKREPDTEYQTYVEKEARRLINRVVSVGEFYLVRAGNTRKGTGTFYTRPQLAVPVVHRTLQPLCYDKQPDDTLVPKTPEAILNLKVCDPACGSASFLVAALHYLTDALYRSLCHHFDLDDPARTPKVHLPFGKPTIGIAKPEHAPFPPNDPHHGHRFADTVKSLLRRHVVERCIYGVDLNPLAVEFARVSLWVETMDRDLPFSFLDHKIKVGNALVGCWLDRVLDYPLKAWEREGGDGKGGPRTERIEMVLKGPKGPNGKRSGDGVIKQDMRELIQTQFQGMPLLFGDPTLSVEGVVDQARGIYAIIHAFGAGDADMRERQYREQFEDLERFKKLRRALDEWCAVWFWPTDEGSFQHVPTPLSFHDRTAERDEIIERLRREHRFFHWELAFPDVFSDDRRGFDAMIGNPPWDVIKPNSQEFFTEFDPLYRTYDKQRAVKRQRSLFNADPGIAASWDAYLGQFKALGNFVASTSDPFDMSLARGKEGTALASAWSRHRAAHGGRGSHPFRLQGSADVNSYKLFAELFWTLLADGGRIGVVLPTGIYSDLGTRPLREELLLRGTVEFIYAFQNERLIFSSATHSTKQVCLVATKAGSTNQFLVRFRMGVGDSPRASELVEDLLSSDTSAMIQSPNSIKRHSPKSLAFVEFKTIRDQDIFKTIYDRASRLGDNAAGWELTFASEFHMTSDSRHFLPVEQWEAKGFKPDEYGRWVSGSGDIAHPLYEGSMIFHFDFAYQGWERGHGASSVWPFIPFDRKAPRPRFLVGGESWRFDATRIKLAYRAVGRNNLTRTMTTACLNFPCGNSLATLTLKDPSVEKALFLQALLDSLCFDFVVRARIAGLNLNWYVIEDCPLVEQVSSADIQELSCRAARLTFLHRRFAPQWLWLQSHFKAMSQDWKQLWAVTESERLRMRVEIEALTAGLYGLTPEDFNWIVRDDPTDPKGFYRVDRNLPFRERLTGLAAAAFRALVDGKWSAESAARMSNDEFFETIGIPELTSESAARALGLPEALIRKRPGCHVWEPEKFPESDPRHGWTWDHCRADAIALLGSEDALVAYLTQPTPAPATAESTPPAPEDAKRSDKLTLSGEKSQGVLF